MLGLLLELHREHKVLFLNIFFKLKVVFLNFFLSMFQKE